MDKYLRKIQEPENSELMMRESVYMISEPSGSKELSGGLRISRPRVGMSSRMAKSSLPTPEMSDSRNYGYDEMIEYQEKLNARWFSVWYRWCGEKFLSSTRWRRVENNIIYSIYVKLSYPGKIGLYYSYGEIYLTLEKAVGIYYLFLNLCFSGSLGMLKMTVNSTGIDFNRKWNIFYDNGDFNSGLWVWMSYWRRWLLFLTRTSFSNF